MSAVVIAFITGLYATLSHSVGLADTVCAIGCSLFFFMCWFFILVKEEWMKWHEVFRGCLVRGIRNNNLGIKYKDQFIPRMVRGISYFWDYLFHIEWPLTTLPILHQGWSEEAQGQGFDPTPENYYTEHIRSKLFCYVYIIDVEPSVTSSFAYFFIFWIVYVSTVVYLFGIIM